MLNLHVAQFEILLTMLENKVPSILLLGDRGVGKKTLVLRAVAKQSHVYFTNYPQLNMEDARSLKQQALRKLHIPRCYLIDGDNASDAAYNAILKLLEEPPPDNIFVICSSRPPLPTIVSRCSCIRVPPLSDKDLLAALLDQGMSERAAQSIVPFAHGSVTQAYQVYANAEQKRRVVPMLKALQDRDLKYVLQQARTITRDDVDLLLSLVDDALLNRYGLLASDVANLVQLTPDFLMDVKSALLAGQSPAIGWLRAWFVTA